MAALVALVLPRVDDLLRPHVEAVAHDLEARDALLVRGREIFAAAGELAFSVVSFAEIGVKAAVGKLTVPDDFHAHVVGSGIRVLGLSADHGLAVASLPLHHRDPFDRLLIAQAQQEGLTLATADPRIHAYDVPVLDPLV